MSAPIVFFITKPQAAYLLALKPAAGDHWRHSRVRHALRARGIIAGNYDHTKITPLGRQTIKLLRMVLAHQARRSPG